MEISLNIRDLYRNHNSLLFYVQGAKSDMQALVGLVAAGELDPVIDRVYPLRDAAAADEHLDAREQFGRIVLTVEQ